MASKSHDEWPNNFRWRWLNLLLVKYHWLIGWNYWIFNPFGWRCHILILFASSPLQSALGRIRFLYGNSLIHLVLILFVYSHSLRTIADLAAGYLLSGNVSNVEGLHTIIFVLQFIIFWCKASSIGRFYMVFAPPCRSSPLVKHSVVFRCVIGTILKYFVSPFRTRNV